MTTTGRAPAALCGLFCAMFSWSIARGADWAPWGGQDSRNMVSDEKGLPDSFVPGERDPQRGGIVLSTARNVRWAARLGSMTCATPAVAGGRVFIGFARDNQGVLLCLDEKTGKPLWQWAAPVRTVPPTIDGRKCWFTVFPRQVGVCSSPAVDADRVYIVTHRCEVACFDVRGPGKGGDAPLPVGKAGASLPASLPASQEAVPRAEPVWLFDMWDYGVRPSDVCDGSILVHGDLLYVATSNGVDRDADARKEDEFRKPPAPTAPTLIVLEKKTGRLVATDDAPIGPNLLHGQWSSPSLGKVGDKTLVFYGGGDGVCYAFEALSSVPKEPVKLKTVWSFDCNPPEYKQFGGLDLVAHYCRGDKRRSDTLNKPGDGNFVGMSEIIATPVFHNNRVYVAIGRDPAHGRGRGALYCIDATKTGDVTRTGKVWSYQGLDRTLSTVSIADGLLYVADMAGRLHCLDADTGRCFWVHETKSQIWGSTMVADGKVYLPTQQSLWIMAHGKEKKVLDKINLGSAVWDTPVPANGVLYVASQNYLWAVGL